MKPRGGIGESNHRIRAPPWKASPLANKLSYQNEDDDEDYSLSPDKTSETVDSARAKLGHKKCVCRRGLGRRGGSIANLQ